MLKRCVAIKMCHTQSFKWDQQYAKFEEQVGKPNKGSPLYNWKQGQLATFDARIKKDGIPFGVLGEICSRDALQQSKINEVECSHVGWGKNVYAKGVCKGHGSTKM